MTIKPKAVVAMSGGVDSSVAAALLRDQGYDVIGLHLDTGVETGAARADSPPDSPPLPAAEQVRRVGQALGIHIESLARHAEFERVIRTFADEYARGRTPNPCIVCNERFKFAHLIEHADHVGAEIVATGHYARIVQREGSAMLARGVDRPKDQSYYLFRVSRRVLPRLRLPLGEMTKPQTREHARALGLPALDRPESQDVCFASRFPYVEIVRRYHPEALRPGEVHEPTGRVIGQHEGLANYTIGQRRGLGIAAGQPMYVAGIDAAENAVTLGPREALLQRRLVGSEARWLADPPDGPFRAHAKVRYRHRAAPATVTPLDGDRVETVFDEPQWAITPGQAVVFYDDEVLLGGAWIDARYDE